MRLLIKIKKLLNTFGYDVRYYHSFWDTVAASRNIRTVIDIGANVGQFSGEVYTHIPAARVYAFEPLPDCFAALKEAMQKHEAFKAWGVALGEAAQDSTIYRSSFTPSSSLLPMLDTHKKLYPKSAENSPEPVQIRRLDDFAHEIIVEGGLMIKMDVQGYEDKVIRGGKDMFRKASLVLAETPFVKLYDKEASFGDVHDLLRELGFSYAGAKSEYRDPKTHEVLYQDSIFVRAQP